MIYGIRRLYFLNKVKISETITNAMEQEVKLLIIDVILKLIKVGLRMIVVHTLLCWTACNNDIIGEFKHYPTIQEKWNQLKIAYGGTYGGTCAKALCHDP